MKEQMLCKICRPYKNTGKMYHRTLENISAKMLNCYRTSTASYSFYSLLFEWHSEMTVYHTAHHCWHEVNIRVHICLNVKVISKYNHNSIQ